MKLCNLNRTDAVLVYNVFPFLSMPLLSVIDSVVFTDVFQKALNDIFAVFNVPTT